MILKLIHKISRLHRFFSCMINIYIAIKYAVIIILMTNDQSLSLVLFSKPYFKIIFTARPLLF